MPLSSSREGAGGAGHDVMRSPVARPPSAHTRRRRLRRGAGRTRPLAAKRRPKQHGRTGCRRDRRRVEARRREGASGERLAGGTAEHALHAGCPAFARQHAQEEMPAPASVALRPGADRPACRVPTIGQSTRIDEASWTLAACSLAGGGRRISQVQHQRWLRGGCSSSAARRRMILGSPAALLLMPCRHAQRHAAAARRRRASSFGGQSGEA
jgi:hypothetical protein